MKSDKITFTASLNDFRSEYCKEAVKKQGFCQVEVLETYF